MGFKPTPDSLLYYRTIVMLIGHYVQSFVDLSLRSENAIPQLDQMTGIEPARPTWKDGTLPLHHIWIFIALCLGHLKSLLIDHVVLVVLF